jgi:hypothetical protein
VARQGLWLLALATSTGRSVWSWWYYSLGQNWGNQVASSEYIIYVITI